MALENISEQVRRLIRENDPRAAADLLATAFRDKNQQLFNIALVQQANLKKLADQNAAGILSLDEVNKEEAKANAALLHLSEEYARLFEGTDTPTDTKSLPRWVLFAGAGIVGLVLIGFLAKGTLFSPNYPKTFDVEVSLYQKGNEAKAIAEGEVNLRLGEAELQSRLHLDAQGKANFKDLNEKYRDSVVQLLYYPINKDRQIKISGQGPTKLTGKDQLIRFSLEFLPDTTVFEATIFGPNGKKITGAQITVDGTLHAISDENGYFKMAIPKLTGSAANFYIEKNGTRLYSLDVTISPGYHEIHI